VADQEKRLPFNRYEIIAVVIPGASLLLVLWLLRPAWFGGAEISSVSLGGFGIFALAAFCAGHIIQAPANIILDSIYCRFGRPTEQMNIRSRGLADAQVERIPQQVESILRLHPPSHPNDQAWKAIIEQIGAAIRNADRGERLDQFNGNFGLFRGLSMALLLLTVVAFFQTSLAFALVCGLGFLATSYRMVRFSRYYARELWVQFLELPPREARPTS